MKNHLKRCDIGLYNLVVAEDEQNDREKAEKTTLEASGKKLANKGKFEKG